jgi:hypothetical protein
MSKGTESVGFNVFVREINVWGSENTTAYSFSSLGRAIGQIIGPPGTDLYRGTGSTVLKLKVPKGQRFPGEFVVYPAAAAIEEARKPDSLLRFEPRV